MSSVEAAAMDCGIKIIQEVSSFVGSNRNKESFVFLVKHSDGELDDNVTLDLLVQSKVGRDYLRNHKMKSLIPLKDRDS